MPLSFFNVSHPLSSLCLFCENTFLLPTICFASEIPYKHFLPSYWPISSIFDQSEDAFAKTSLHSANKYVAASLVL